jgi:dihydrofolate synthase/folylpolyglutamate synthase
MLRDKDMEGVLRELAPRITRWHFCSLHGPRGASAQDLEAALRAAGSTAPASRHDSPGEALAAARREAGEDDKIVVFGSFLTVGEATAWLEKKKKTSTP